MTTFEDVKKCFNFFGNIVLLLYYLLIRAYMTFFSYIADTPSEKSQSEVKRLGRSWACQAHTLMYSLSDISAVESSVVQGKSYFLS